MVKFQVQDARFALTIALQEVPQLKENVFWHAVCRIRFEIII